MKLTIHCYAACLSFILAITIANAQSAYSLHTLAAGETLSMLAKNYHTTVGDIMRMNSMNAQSQLQVGAQIKIPAGGTVVVQKPAATVAAQVIPAGTNPKTHVVTTGETLFHISQLYNIPVEQLKAINKLTDGSVKVGQTLLLSEGATPSQPLKAKTEQTSAAPKETIVQTPVKETPQPAPVKQSPATTTLVVETPQQKNNTAQLTNITKPDNASPADNSNAFNNNYSNPGNAPKEGFFTNLYGSSKQSKSEETKNGTAMTFKSASGWADKKYYILMNDAPTGSIVKIKNGKNELYAKVLWNLSSMKENDGLAFRISTATAAALGVTDEKFDLRVSYYE